MQSAELGVQNSIFAIPSMGGDPKLKLVVSGQWSVVRFCHPLDGGQCQTVNSGQWPDFVTL